MTQYRCYQQGEDWILEEYGYVVWSYDEEWHIIGRYKSKDTLDEYVNTLRAKQAEIDKLKEQREKTMSYFNVG